MKPLTLLLCTGAIAAVGGVFLFSQNRQNAHLTEQIRLLVRDRSRSAEATVYQSAKHESVEQATQPPDANSSEKTKLLREIAELEKAAEAKQSERLAQRRAAAESHDPETGMTRMENLRNVGQATPAADRKSVV